MSSLKPLMKQVTFFKYACHKFPALSMKKLKAGIFDGPQIRTLMQDSELVNHITQTESKAWQSSVLVVKNFLGNYKALAHAEVYEHYENMSNKLHFLHSHLDRFLDNLGDYSGSHVCPTRTRT